MYFAAGPSDVAIQLVAIKNAMRTPNILSVKCHKPKMGDLCCCMTKSRFEKLYRVNPGDEASMHLDHLYIVLDTASWNSNIKGMNDLADHQWSGRPGFTGFFMFTSILLFSEHSSHCCYCVSSFQ